MADLVEMARAPFGTLSRAEMRLLLAAPGDSVAHCGDNEDEDDPANDPADGHFWSNERTIRAGLIKWLVTEPEALKQVHPSGIGAAGARIIERLDLFQLKVDRAITLRRCLIGEGIDLSYAQIPSLDLSGSWSGPIAAPQLKVTGDVSLSAGFCLWGELLLTGARLEGDFDASAAKFHNPEAAAISAERMFVGGRFRLSDESNVVGSIELRESHLSGELRCAGTFRRPSDRPHAISAPSAQISGEVAIQNATIYGGVDLTLARIGRNLSVIQTSFEGDTNGLEAPGATVGSTIFWLSVRTNAATVVSFFNAKADGMWDQRESWPVKGKLIIDGLTYR